MQVYAFTFAPCGLLGRAWYTRQKLTGSSTRKGVHMFARMLTARMRFVHFVDDVDEEKKGESGGSAGGKTETGERTFTQAELDRHIQERLARQKEADKKEQDKAKMDVEDRLKTEKAEAEQAKAAAEERAKIAEWRADLAGNVVDAKKAIKLIDPETHLNTDGSVNVEKFLKDNPFMRLKKKRADDDDDEDEGDDLETEDDQDEDEGDERKRKRSTGPGAGGTNKKSAPDPDSWDAAFQADRKIKRGR
jgi:hypothetical protein